MGLDFVNRFAKYEVDTVKTRKGLDLYFMVSQGLGASYGNLLLLLSLKGYSNFNSSDPITTKPVSPLTIYLSGMKEVLSEESRKIGWILVNSYWRGLNH